MECVEEWTCNGRLKRKGKLIDGPELISNLLLGKRFVKKMREDRNPFIPLKTIRKTGPSMYVFNEVGTCWGHYMESLCVSLLSVICAQQGNFILGQMKRRRDRSTFLHSWPVAGNSLPFTLHIHGWQAVWLIILIKLTPANDGVFMKRMTLQEPSHRRYSVIFYCCKMKERWKAALSRFILCVFRTPQL